MTEKIKVSNTIAVPHPKVGNVCRMSDNNVSTLHKRPMTQKLRSLYGLQQ